MSDKKQQKQWWVELRKLVGPTGKVVSIPDGGILIKCSCLAQHPHTRNPNERFRARGDVAVALDEWAVHLTDHHPDVTTPVLSRLHKGARERVEAHHQELAAKADAQRSRVDRLIDDVLARYPNFSSPAP